MTTDTMSERMKAKFAKYKPESVQSARAGADDHLKFKSKGF